MSDSNALNYLTRTEFFCGRTLLKPMSRQDYTNQNQAALLLMAKVTAHQVVVMLYHHPVVLSIHLRLQFYLILVDSDFLFSMKQQLRQVFKYKFNLERTRAQFRREI